MSWLYAYVILPVIPMSLQLTALKCAWVCLLFSFRGLSTCLQLCSVTSHSTFLLCTCKSCEALETRLGTVCAYVCMFEWVCMSMSPWKYYSCMAPHAKLLHSHQWCCTHCIDLLQYMVVQWIIISDINTASFIITWTDLLIMKNLTTSPVAA